jgi:monothiol glutaredoxin
MTFDPDAGLAQEDVEKRVDAAIETSEVVLFMRGNPMLPQCGYSARALELIAKHRRDFGTVDTLESLEEFRAALSDHSGWETIPQVYVDGEFVGGSDILAELEERGELAASLAAEA